MIVRWTTPKNLAAVILFFAIGVIIEALLISAFQILGLSDQNAFASTFLLPGTNWSLTFSVSFLFHLLPLSVVLVLLASWTYLAKSTAFVPERIEAARRASQPPRRSQEVGRLKTVRRPFKNLNRRLQRFGRAMKSGFQRIPGVSYVSKRLVFARVAVKSAVTVLAVFVSITAAAFLITYPDLTYNLTVNLYRSSPALVDFVAGIGQWFRGAGTAISPLSDLGASINNALLNAAPGFRRSLEAAGTSLTRPIVQLDAVGKYALSQNLAAWTTAITALLYGAYASARLRRRVKGR